MNLTVLAGRLAAPPEIAVYDTGGSRLRLLVAVKSQMPNPRLDLLPVAMWKPPEHLADLDSGQRVWVLGAIHRRFRQEATPDRRRSSIQVVAHQIQLEPIERVFQTLNEA